MIASLISLVTPFISRIKIFIIEVYILSIILKVTSYINDAIIIPIIITN